MQIYYKTNLIWHFQTTQNVVRNFHTKESSETTELMTPCVIIQICYYDLLCGIGLWENSYLGCIHSFSIQTFSNNKFTLCG